MRRKFSSMKRALRRYLTLAAPIFIVIVLVMTADGYVKRTNPDEYKAQQPSRLPVPRAAGQNRVPARGRGAQDQHLS